MAIQAKQHVAYATPMKRTPTGLWIAGFFAFQMACQLSLLLPQLGAVRMVVRVAAFGASLAFLLAFPGRYQKHPASWPALGIVGLLALAIFHPLTNTYTAGVAQAALYLAIIAPVWWVSGLKMDPMLFRKILLMLWGFHTLSALTGVIQTSFPGKLTPTVSAVVADQGDWYVEDMKITLANGQKVFRPMGLSDYPGGAATAGFYVVLLGLGLWSGEKNAWWKMAFMASLPAALFCLYLSQQRSMMVMTAVCAIALIGLLAVRGEMAKVASLSFAFVGMVGISFAWAAWVGGDVVTKRLSSLVDEKPGDVYYSNRGHFLDTTINEILPRAPLGAGLGRWGMMYYYFGNKDDPDRGEIWAEIQWTGWILDGGLPLVLLYAAAMGCCFYIAGLASMDRGASGIALLAAMVFAYDVGALAMTFNYPLFIGQGGLEFWIINAGLFAAWNVDRNTRYIVLTEVPK